MSLLGLSDDDLVTPIGMARSLLEKVRAKCVMVTLGERGVAVADASGDRMIAAPEVKAVDTSGAGDVFCAGLAVGLVEGKDVRVAAGWACTAAALSVTRPGTIPAFPIREEVDSLVRL
jgi:ribokinase